MALETPRQSRIPRWLTFLTGGLFGAAALGAVLLFLALRDLGGSLVDAGNAAMGYHYFGQSVAELNAENRMLHHLALTFSDAATRSRVETIVDEAGWERIDGAEDRTLYALFEGGRLGFVFEENRLIALTGICHGGDPYDDCPTEGET